MPKHTPIIFGSPLIEQPEIDDVTALLKAGWIGTGPKTAQFEEMFARYKAVAHAAALNSCTAALNCALLALDIRRGDEVIVPALTYAPTAHAIVHAQARPVFVDCCKDTQTIDCDLIRKKITRRTRAIIPVHFAGRPCQMDQLCALAKKHHLRIIEDCAHAIEARYHGKHAGTIGDIGCFSFYVTKNITCGEGGMAITRSAALDRKMRMLALHGMGNNAWKRFKDKKFRHHLTVMPGFKYTLPDILAVIGLRQLPRIEKYWKRREAIWNRYNAAFRGLPVQLPAPAETDTKHAYHLYTLLLDIEKLNFSRDRFANLMIANGVGVGVHFIALHMHPFYKKTYRYTAEELPCASWISARTVSLPLSPKLSDQQVQRVIDTTTALILKGRKRRFH